MPEISDQYSQKKRKKGLILRKFIRRIQKGTLLLCRLFLRYLLFFRRDKVCTSVTARCDENPWSINFYYERKGRNSPVCCINHLYELLTFLGDLLDANSVEWFAIIGTHLGAVRHGGFNPWETDGDIGVHIRDKEKVKELLEKALSGTHYYLEEREECLQLQFSRKNSLHVDIIWGNEENDNIVFVTKGLRRIYPKKDIYPLAECRFYHRTVPVPHNRDVLKTFYGENVFTHGYKQWSRDKREFLIEDFSPAPIFSEDKK